MTMNRDIYDRSTYDVHKHLQCATDLINLKEDMDRLDLETRQGFCHRRCEEETSADIEECHRKICAVDEVYDGWVTTQNLVGMSNYEYRLHISDLCNPC